MANVKDVIIVGAGPAGLLLALLLAQQGIQVRVPESKVQVDQRPRGISYGPSATQALRRAGIIDEIRSQTWDMTSMSRRKLGGEVLVERVDIDHTDPDRFLLYPVHLLSNLLLEHVLQHPSALVSRSHPVIASGQNHGRAWVDVSLRSGIERLEADFVVGCDGASSVVRKALFGDIFPGFTWAKKLVVTNVRYDVSKFGWSDAQWIIDTRDWGMVCGVSKSESLWRVVYGEDVSLTDAQLLERLPLKFKRILPGNPLIKKMRVGRILLVADAAHLCNPMGGLGLTRGLADVESLFDCLLGIDNGKAGLDILDTWDEVRRGIYSNLVDPISSANLERLRQFPDEIKYTDPGFNLIRQAESDPEIANKLHLKNIAYDMTQHYHHDGNNSEEMSGS